MIYRRCIPEPRLAQFVEFCWYYEAWDATPGMEHVLPDGTFELIINLRDEPRKLFDRDRWDQFALFKEGWLSGAHRRYMVIDVLPRAAMIGVHFKPGGAAAFMGTSAAELGDRVVELPHLWGEAASEWRERLAAVSGVEEKFCVLQRLLLDRLDRSSKDDERQRKIQWAVGELSRQPEPPRIGELARRLGMSHRHLIDQFRHQVGLTPKVFCRIQRFQRILAQIRARQKLSWADAACTCGYYDQAHFIRDFHEFSGLNPSDYAAASPEDPNFVRIDAGR